MSAANKEVGFPWPVVLITFYTLGVLLALMRPVLGLWGIRQLSRLSVPLTDHSVQTLAADSAAARRLPRLPELRQAAVPVPMTWGSRRPTILLPQGAENWPEDRLRAVLLHEMAHIRRQDWPGHRLADITCALYWFQPFVWLTARRLRAESEAACDDLVLASGIPAPDYARHLLEIARALPPVSRNPQYAIAMAQSSRVEGRLKMILDQTRNRRLPRRGAIGVALALSAGLALAVATAQTEPHSLMAAITSGGFPLDTPAHAVAEAAFLKAQIERFGDKDPWAGKAYYMLGNAQTGMQHPAEAVASYDKAIALPEPPYANSGIHSSARYERIDTLEAAGRYDEAVTDTQKLLQNGGRGLISPDLWENLRQRLPEFQMLRDDMAKRDQVQAFYAAFPASPDLRWTQTLPNGVTVQLVGCQQHTGEKQDILLHTAWTPGGKFLAQAKFERNEGDSTPTTYSGFTAAYVAQEQAKRAHGVGFVLRLTYPPGLPVHVGYALAGDPGAGGMETGADGLMTENGSVVTDEAEINRPSGGLRLAAAHFSVTQNTATLRVGIAVGSKDTSPLSASDPAYQWAEFPNITLPPVK